MDELEIRCKECRRYLGLKGIYTVIAQVRCSNSKCHAMNNVKVVTSDSSESQIRYRFEVNNG